MLRNRAVALILCCMASPFALGLGLGPLEATSALNEPFKGRIEILGVEAADFDALTVGLAGEDQFARAGIERHPVLFQLRFAVDGDAPGKDYIAITSKDPVREPFLNFLLELNWANGRLLREYTVLLDPPLYDPNKRRVVPATTAAPAAPAAVATTSRGSAAAVAVPQAGLGSYTAGGSIGPVGASDTLWSLASAYRPHDGISVQQMMLALLRENPDAFSQGNINMLRRGAVLRLPDAASIDAITSSEAYAEVRRQHEIWEEYRQQIGAAPAPQPLGAPPAPVEAPVGAATATPSTEPAADARLELVAPGGTDGGGGIPGQAGAGGSELLRNEQMDAQAREAAELKEKLTEAEEIIDLLQRQVNIKDEELAALQARMAELGIEHGDLTPAAADETAAAAEPGATSEQAVVEAEAPSAAGAEPTTPPTTEVVTEPEAEIEIDTEAAAPTEETAPAATDADAVLDVEGASPPTAPAGFPANLIPPGVAALVPGGAVTVLFVAALVILGLFAAVTQALVKARGRSVAMPALGSSRQARVDDDARTVTAASAAAADVDTTLSDAAEAPTEAPAFDPNATVEAESDATLAPTAAEGDPLEEVNVYLAYERFDQAEELVKRVIGQYPTRHEYKLRLLEVYYSANDRVAYEAAARVLLDAVGADDALWASAVAMWTEMSPDRALFEEGGTAEAAPAAETSTAFVDITSDADEPRFGESTIAHAPGGPAGGLDLDLGSGNADDTDILDLTATVDADVLFDVTTATGSDSDVFDLTTGEGESEGDSGVFDISGTGLEADTDLLDLSAGGDAGLLDVTGGGQLLDLTGSEAAEQGGGSDLLDVTKTGDISQFEDHDLLNVTSPGLRGHDDLGSVDASADGEVAGGLDFDISGTVAPAFQAQADDDEEVGILDITGGGGSLGDDALEFDIGGFDAPAESDDAGTVELDAGLAPSGAGLDLDFTDGGGGGDLDFDITMGEEELGSELEPGTGGDDEELEITLSAPAEGELSLQGAALDELALDAAGLEVEDGDQDFDFSLDGTTEMDALAADDTLDMASVATSNDEILNGGDETSLDDLTMELDAALDIGGGDDLQLDIEGIDEAHMSTLSLELDNLDSSVEHGEKTVVMPAVAAGDRDGDEADTKLNLAKAYIELGDTDGARSILDEVVGEGNAAQQAEARNLLSQLQA